MKTGFITLAAFCFLAPLSAAAGEVPAATACVYKYKGEVQLRQPGSAEWLTLLSGAPLTEGASLKTGGGAWCQILAADGTFINLYENSETVIETLKLDKESRNYGFNFIKGRILWMVAKLKNRVSKFEVRTPSAVCAVRGTDFTIDVASATADIGMFEGELDIKSGGKETVLKSGSEAVVAAPGSETAVSDRLSRLMQAEQRRYLKLKKHADNLRAKLAAREGFIDDFIKDQRKKLQDFENRRQEKLKRHKE